MGWVIDPSSWGRLWGGDHLNLETCVDNTFKVGPKDREECVYASHNYFLLVQFSLELPMQSNG